MSIIEKLLVNLQANDFFAVLIAWIVAVAAVCVFGQHDYVPVTLGILTGALGLLAMRLGVQSRSR
jgi:hypothetical protein